MCSIFGFVNYGNKVNGRQLKELVRALSIEAEARGKDASGIAYVRNGELVIYKKAEPAHKMKFYFPSDTKILTGHTRMTTQGSPKHNFNNHPFLGKTKDGYFALCHNGVICNDHLLEEYEQLPKSFIETDSYVAVKLLEKYGSLNFQNIAKMSEIVYGTFVFTMLNEDNTLYISKGENPLCLLYFKKLDLYVYVSTYEIMLKALKRCFLRNQPFEVVNVSEGEIIRINERGKLERGCFIPESRCNEFEILSDYGCYGRQGELFDVCNSFGMSQDDLILLYEMGYDDEEIECMLYDSDFMRQCVEEARICMSEYF